VGGGQCGTLTFIQRCCHKTGSNKKTQPQCWLAQNNIKAREMAKEIKKKKEHHTRRKKPGKEEQEKECREL
jgi:hypothetical protein